MKPALWEAPAISKQVDDILSALEVGPIDAESRGVFQRMIHRQKYFGGDAKGRIIFIIRTITESEGNEGALIGPIVSAVSSCLTPEIIDHGLKVIEAFDKIPLVSIFETMRSLNAFDEYWLSHYYSIAVRNKLASILRAGARPVLTPVKVKREPLSVTRVPQIERAIALGTELLALRSAISSNTQFGREVRRRYPGVDQITAGESMKVARVYGTRSEIYRRLSWIALFELSSPKMSQSVRQAIETKILAGQSVTAPQIRLARGRLKTGSPKRRPADQPARRMAA